MDEENLKDAIAKAAEKHLTANPEMVYPEGMKREGLEINFVSRTLRNQAICFLWDMMKLAANSEMVATPEGMKAIAEVATALKEYLYC